MLKIRKDEKIAFLQKRDLKNTSPASSAHSLRSLLAPPRWCAPETFFVICDVLYWVGGFFFKLPALFCPLISTRRKNNETDCFSTPLRDGPRYQDGLIFGIIPFPSLLVPVRKMNSQLRIVKGFNLKWIIFDVSHLWILTVCATTNVEAVVSFHWGNEN